MKVRFILTINLITILILIPSNETQILNLPKAPAIVGGADASPGQFPYQLSLKFGNENKCGAVLINYHLAITAAHCCDNILKYKNEIWSVVAGEHTISKREKSEQVRTDFTIIKRGDYKPPKFMNDICALKFEKPFKRKQKVEPINLAAKTPYFGEDCTISGWGVLSEYESDNSDILQYANIKILQDNICEKSYGMDNFKREHMICAGFPNGQTDSCQGDSGGPLVCGGKLVGIVSFGNGCARPGYPGVYTKIEYYNEWIAQIAHQGNNNGNIKVASLSVNFLTFLLIFITR